MRSSTEYAGGSTTIYAPKQAPRTRHSLPEQRRDVPPWLKFVGFLPLRLLPFLLFALVVIAGCYFAFFKQPIEPDSSPVNMAFDEFISTLHAKAGNDLVPEFARDLDLPRSFKNWECFVTYRNPNQNACYVWPTDDSNTSFPLPKTADPIENERRIYAYFNEDGGLGESTSTSDQLEIGGEIRDIQVRGDSFFVILEECQRSVQNGK